MSTESAEAWSAVAAGWERQAGRMAASMEPVTVRLLERLAPKPGEVILEIGAGTGEVGRRVAGLVRADGRVIVTDVAEGMLDAARRIGAGIPNVEYALVDAQQMPFETASVDAIVARFAYMLVPDVRAGFRESARVVRPGGRLAFAVWASGAENPWGSTVGRTLVDLGLMEPPEPDAPGPFRLADRERVKELVADAGFGEPEIEDLEIELRYSSLDEFWEVTGDLSMSLRQALMRLNADEAAQLRSRVNEMLGAYAGANGLVLPGRARVVSATRP
jgi:SAM-dependent methyltransferase